MNSTLRAALLLLVLLTSIRQAAGQSEITETPSPTPTLTPTPTPTPTATESYRFTGTWWAEAAPGLDYGYYYPPYSQGAQLFIVRFDPALYAVRTHYRPRAPLDRAGWSAELPGAVAIVNANYFNLDQTASGLVIADGERFGQSFVGRGGMLLMDRHGVIRVRSIVREPYERRERLDQVVQGYPVLVQDGHPVFHPLIEADELTRRTVIAQDATGRLLLITTPGLGITLGTLAHYLAATDLEIRIAVNFDGGTSALLQWSPPGGTAPMTIDSFYAVPTVLAVYTR